MAPGPFVTLAGPASSLARPLLTGLALVSFRECRVLLSLGCSDLGCAGLTPTGPVLRVGPAGGAAGGSQLHAWPPSRGMSTPSPPAMLRTSVTLVVTFLEGSEEV